MVATLAVIADQFEEALAEPQPTGLVEPDREILPNATGVAGQRTCSA